ncbi:GGDEF domain-containing protein [Azospirillum thermophilum]|uniref:GGDEF domain-containing protein n=1 Tax=Azospirillum thermophilum TaxID=2202148 RepID=UPI0011B42AC9|nr:diguanylate cyclase [Azospirillum thermophilum]
MEHVILTGIDLEWMSGISQEIARSTGGAVALVASDGTVITRVPDAQSFSGRMMADHPVIAHAIRNTKGTVDGTGLDAVPRIHGFARLPASDSTLIVGIARDDVVGPINAEVMTSAAVVLAVVLGITVGVWFLMDVLVLRGLRHLQQSAARLSTGQIDGLSPCAPGGIPALEVGKAVQAVRRMGQTLHTVAFTDPLTGLANRRFFDAFVERCEALPPEERTPQAILCIDLDGFKPVNDRYGHAVGDAVLKAVASRLMRCVREVDQVVRFGGDEFAILLDMADQPDEEQALRVAERVVKALSVPVKAEGVELQIGCSVGIAVWPTDDRRFDTVLRYADQALYSAKRRGRGQARRHRDLVEEREQRPDAV